MQVRVLGIDIGTTTISAVIVNDNNCDVERAYTIKNDSFIKTIHDWEQIQDPDKIIFKVRKIIDEVFETYSDISAIGITGQMHGIVYVDKSGKHISPLYTWQDMRGNEEIQFSESVCDMIYTKYNQKVYTGYGLVTHIYNGLYGLIPEGASKICTIMDYLGMVLTGRSTPLVHSSNAASFGLFDTEKACFFNEIIKDLNLDEKILPQIINDFSLLGTYKGTPVCVAIGDNQASFLGSVRDEENSVLVNIGTGAQISVMSDVYFEAIGIETRPFIGHKFLLVGSSLCGGRAYAVLENFFREYAEALNVNEVNHYDIMEKLLRNRRENNEKLIVRTTFTGTREEPEKHGSIQNITIDNWNPASLIHGFLEGIVDELFGMYENILKGTLKKENMIASGNGIRKNHYLQDIMSEKFSMSVKMAKCEEEAAYGAALYGLFATDKKSLEKILGTKNISNNLCDNMV